MNLDDLTTRLEMSVQPESLSAATLTAMKQRGLRRRRTQRAAVALSVVAAVLVLAGAAAAIAGRSSVSPISRVSVVTPHDTTTSTPASDRPRPLHGYPPGTNVIPAGHWPGVIVGYIEADYIVGPRSGGPPPDGMPGYPITNKGGTLLYGYEIPLLGAVRRSIAENPRQLALLKTCSTMRVVVVPDLRQPTSAPPRSTSTEPSRACTTILAEAKQPFGLEIPIPKALPPRQVHGRMYMDGGPTNATTPVNGTVRAVNETHGYTVATVRNGAFTVALPPGTYFFVGRSPQWNAGAPCPTVGPLVVGTSRPRQPALSVSVVCPRQ